MRILAVALAALWWTAAPAAGQCCGDCSGDGEVSISDLIQAVNNALNGCSQATPTSGTPPTATRTPTPTRKPTNTRKPTATATPADRCPSTFSTVGNNLCLFNGTYNRSCGSALNSTFSSTGSVIIVTLATNLVDPTTVSFSANVTNSTAAALTAWSSDNFQSATPVTGIVTLNSNGQQLVVFPDNSPFMIQGCSFVQYLGAYQRPRSAAAAAVDDSGRLIPDLADP